MGVGIDGTMKVSGRLEPTDGTPAGDRIVTATLLPNGTLEGTFGSDHGQIKLTAERFTDRPTRRGVQAHPAENGQRALPLGVGYASLRHHVNDPRVASSGSSRVSRVSVLVSGDTVCGSPISTPAPGSRLRARSQR